MRCMHSEYFADMLRHSLLFQVQCFYFTLFQKQMVGPILLGFFTRTLLPPAVMVNAVDHSPAVLAPNL